MNIILQFKIWIRLMLDKKVSGRRYLQIRKEDVFLVSYPKSGNTWMRFLIGNLISSERVNFDNVNNIIPDIHSTSSQELNNYLGQRIIKSHLSYTKVYPKVIYIFRDPRDVVVSYYFWKKKYNKDFTENISDFIKTFIDGKCSVYGPWEDHLFSWINSPLKTKKKILIIKYEYLKVNAIKEIRRVCDFLNLEVDDEQIKIAVNNSTFKEMQKLEVAQSGTSDFLKNSDKSIKFIRSINSEWKQYMTGDLKNSFKEKYGKLLIELGYENNMNW